MKKTFDNLDPNSGPDAVQDGMDEHAIEDEQGDVEKPKDWLPDGTEQTDYLKKEKEWVGLDRRLGNPRILDHPYFWEVIDWVQKEHGDNPDELSYFEAGVGHGNDFRAIRNKLDGKGRFLGVDMSEAEIFRGLDFYQEQEDTGEARKQFAQGDLTDLRHVNVWNAEQEDYSEPAEIEDGEFDLAYMEAVLHGLGYGRGTYQEKKEAAQQVLNELNRICKEGAKFFGRTSTFDESLTKEQQMELLRDTDNWRFVPGFQEFEEMLKEAGFKDIKVKLAPHPRAETDPNKKNILKLSFLAHK
ncbi:class I SAM-dependent methyltransferase [Patescibacteria group bacterium]|nr:class I SAM-dependent methyltransferase [Patescibacteria group bacterium]MBU1951800.1 class I SAM-dependent methyltransferase [Patescibacteria group bacterium]